LTGFDVDLKDFISGLIESRSMTDSSAEMQDLVGTLMTGDMSKDIERIR